MLLPALVPSSSNYDIFRAGKPALTYRLAIEIDSRRAAGCRQRAGGYVSLRCNIGGEFGERPRGVRTSTVHSRKYLSHIRTN